MTVQYQTETLYDNYVAQVKRSGILDGEKGVPGGGNNLADVLSSSRRLARTEFAKVHAVMDELFGRIQKTEKSIKRDIEEIWERYPTQRKTWHEVFEAFDRDLGAIFAYAQRTLIGSFDEKVKRMDSFTICLFGKTKAGKSTTMEALTRGKGQTIGQGRQNTTLEAEEYQWNGLKRRGDDAVTRLAESLNTCLQVLQEDNGALDQSALARDVRNRIAGSVFLKEVFSSFAPQNPTGEKGAVSELLESLQKIAKVSGKDIPKEWSAVLRSTNIVEATSKLLKMVNRDVVLKFGHALGYKFKPWEAVDLSKKLAKAVPLLNLVAAGWEIESHRRERKREEDTARQLRQFKTDVRAMLRETANSITHAVYHELVGSVERVLVSSLELVKEQKQKLAAYAKDYQAAYDELEAKRTECLVLYSDIYDTPAIESEGERTGMEIVEANSQ